ncbi:MAG: ammonia-forming cytochrome c nitrite reductase subunit c552 [Chloroflexi bacterium]|nr:ammonia-forming cytochrome c nitrite reductase subunit c552 [Chloroflexota bacterium]
MTSVQDKTAELLRRSEEALLPAADVLVAAREAGAGDEELAEAQQLYRAGSLRWDLISSEKGRGNR